MNSIKTALRRNGSVRGWIRRFRIEFRIEPHAYAFRTVLSGDQPTFGAERGHGLVFRKVLHVNGFFVMLRCVGGEVTPQMKGIPLLTGGGCHTDTQLKRVGVVGIDGRDLSHGDQTLFLDDSKMNIFIEIETGHERGQGVFGYIVAKSAIATGFIKMAVMFE